jgi:hypothetical protein
LRDNDPASKIITTEEAPNDSRLRSGNILLDALYSMSLTETRQNSQNTIQDGAFNQGQPVSCNCFQTGQKWTWAWTRDTAYSVDLGLALIDPQRSMNTMLFKLSGAKAKTGLPATTNMIVQDTGTGGSWPVSSDRVIWAIGAAKLFATLSHANHQTFQTQAYQALVQTIEHDRQFIFDVSDGLYQGEQSFLDWREQSYPSWSPSYLATIAMSKSLSTNVAHLIAIQTAAQLAAWQNQPTANARYQQWANALKTSIKKGFTRPGTPLLSLMKTHPLAPHPVARYDLLGNSLAILAGVTTKQESLAILSAYPHGPEGAPVQWPQQPLTPIYHNRAIWPFVTAYWLKAAAQSRHDSAFTANFRTLIKGAALNLSNMENFEFVTLKNYAQDGSFSGPVVNSRRQLWSVAALLSSFIDGLFGLQLKRDANGTSMKVTPFLPHALVKEWKLASNIQLQHLDIQGKRLTITLHIPPTSNTIGALDPGPQNLNGTQQPADWFPIQKLATTSTLQIDMKEPQTANATTITTRKENGDFRVWFSPKEPSITTLRQSAGILQLTISSNGEQGTTHNIYRDGRLVASGVPPGTWSDKALGSASTQSPCYSVESTFPSSGNTSHMSLPVCWHGHNQRRLQILDAWHFRAVGGRWSSGTPQKETYTQWGQDKDILEVKAFRPHWTGQYRLQFRYKNPSGAISTGITCATKTLDIREASTNKLVSSLRFVMPQTGPLTESRSTIHYASLDASKTYTLTLRQPDGIVNMSYLEHFAIYNGGAGGGANPSNQTHIITLELAPTKGTDSTPSTGHLIRFDGKNDLNKFPTGQIIQPGIPLETWSRFALTWDKDWLYVAVVSKGFEASLKAFMLYIEAAPSTLPSATPATGLTYLQLTPQLPFSPTHLIGVRQQTDNNDGFGPWNGIWRAEKGTWLLQQRLKPGRESWLAADKHTISFRVRRGQLGWPSKIRLVGHLVNALPNNEWKVTIPSTHTPWKAHQQGFYEINLNQSPSATQWVVR